MGSVIRNLGPSLDGPWPERSRGHFRIQTYRMDQLSKEFAWASKSGLKTSEFWITLAAILMGAGTIVMVVLVGKTWWSHLLGGVIGLGAIYKAKVYTMARVELKRIIAQYFGNNTPPPDPLPTPLPPVVSPPPSPTPTLPPVVLPPLVVPPRPETLTVTTKTVRGGGTVTTIKLSPTTTPATTREQ